MALDPLLSQRNRASTNRIRKMGGLSETDLRTPVGEHWTVAILLAHLAFWDQRVLFVLDKTEQEGKLFAHQADSYVNDYSLPLLAAIAPQDAVRLAVEAAQALDERLETVPAELLGEIQTYNPRWVDRSLHRNDHLDEADEALIKQR